MRLAELIRSSEGVKSAYYFSRDFAIGSTDAPLELASFPLVMPTTIRRWRDSKPLISSVATRESGGIIAGVFASTFASCCVLGNVAQEFVEYIFRQASQGNYAPAIITGTTLTISNAISGIYERERYLTEWKKFRRYKKIKRARASLRRDLEAQLKNKGESNYPISGSYRPALIQPRNPQA